MWISSVSGSERVNDKRVRCGDMGTATGQLRMSDQNPQLHQVVSSSPDLSTGTRRVNPQVYTQPVNTGRHDMQASQHSAY